MMMINTDYVIRVKIATNTIFIARASLMNIRICIHNNFCFIFETQKSTVAPTAYLMVFYWNEWTYQIVVKVFVHIYIYIRSHNLIRRRRRQWFCWP